MSKIRDLIKKDLEEEFSPKFQDLSKAGAVAAAAGGGSNGAGKPPKPPMPPSAPKTPSAKKPPSAMKQRPASATQRPTAASLKPKTPKASGMKATGQPKMPMGDGMEKDAMKPDQQRQGDRRNRGERYHIHQDGQRLTEGHETVTLNEIKRKHGSVQSFESKGFRLVPADRRNYQKNEEVYEDVMKGHKPRFLGDIKELAKSNPEMALAAIPYELAKKIAGHVIAGEHIPTDKGDPPKPKKVKGNKDEGSGGETKKEEIPANEVIEPKDKESLCKECKCEASECKCELEKGVLIGNPKNPDEGDDQVDVVPPAPML